MVAPINREYPLRQVRTLTELVEIAVGMEHEAASRYQELTNYMKQRGETHLAATFGQLAELERRHGDELRDWATRKGLPAPQPKQFSWRLPETFSLKDVGGAALSPYLILGIAVRNEELAFAFYTYVSALTDAQPEVRECAESFAREELKHVAQLRKLRRGAYHSQRKDAPKRRPAATTLADLHRLAWGLESGSSELTALAARRLAADGHATEASLLDQASADAAARATDCANLCDGGKAPEGSEAAQEVRSGDPAALTAEALLALCERDAQDVLEAYLSTADQATTETVLGQSQRLAESAVGRLALIRSLLVQERGETFIKDWE